MATPLLTGPRVIGALAIAAAVLAVAVMMRTPPAAATLAEVGRGAMTVTVDDLGRTRVVDLYTVSAPISGELDRSPLKVGDAVQAGRTLVARIRPALPGPLDARTQAQAQANVRALDAQLAAARAAVAQAQAQATLAERAYQRTTQLAEREYVAAATVDAARTERERSQAALTQARDAAEAAQHASAAARAALIVADSNAAGRGAVSVLAPTSGEVLRVPQESERVVAAGTPLLDVGDPTRLEIVAELLSSDAVKVAPGAPALIDAWGGEQPLRATVRRVEPFGFTKISALGVEEQRVNVLLDFAEPREAWHRLGHGYRATVRIEIWRADDVLRVPVGALFRDGDRWAVFTIDERKRARLTPLEIGRMNETFGEVRSGLEAGARVVLHPSDKISDGVRVSDERR
ncbi:MAG: efflux RND transporter periplasmic adaptor subunit [Burkholderiaceae bacterium]